MIPTRRKVLWALAALAARPVLGYAQAPDRARRVAWLGVGRSDAPSPYLEALRSGLSALGWEEGRNLTLTLYWATGSVQQGMEPHLAREIVATKPEVIVTQEHTTLAVQRLRPESSVPVVFGFSGNPVDAGLVQSFARPGGNFTGISYLALDLVGKRIEFLKEVVPTVRRIAILARPQHPGEHRERLASEEVGRKLGIGLVYFPIGDMAELDKAFRETVQAHCDALIVFPDAVMFANSERIARFAIEAKLPAVSGWERFADAGLLLTYGPNLRDTYRILARYVDQILRGTNPGELPVELPRSVELVVNARTARALGVRLPQSILLRADRVIE